MTTKNFTVVQGKTFNPIIRWSALPWVYVAITAISRAAPVVVTAPSHGMPDGWLAAIVSAKGMDEINSQNDPPKLTDMHKATVVNTNTVQFNDINSSDFSPYTSGGYLQFYTPVDLTGAIARMKVKTKVGGTVLADLSSPTGITINAANRTIQPVISATATAALAKGSYVYDLEVEIAGVVREILRGSFTVQSEITT